MNSYKEFGIHRLPPKNEEQLNTVDSENFIKHAKQVLENDRILLLEMRSSFKISPLAELEPQILTFKMLISSIYWNAIEGKQNLSREAFEIFPYYHFSITPGNIGTLRRLSFDNPFFSEILGLESNVYFQRDRTLLFDNIRKYCKSNLWLELMIICKNIIDIDQDFYKLGDQLEKSKVFNTFELISLERGI